MLHRIEWEVGQLVGIKLKWPLALKDRGNVAKLTWDSLTELSPGRCSEIAVAVLNWTSTAPFVRRVQRRTSCSSSSRQHIWRRTSRSFSSRLLLCLLLFRLWGLSSSFASRELHCSWWVAALSCISVAFPTFSNSLEAAMLLGFQRARHGHATEELQCRLKVPCLLLFL